MHCLKYYIIVNNRCHLFKFVKIEYICDLNKKKSATDCISCQINSLSRFLQYGNPAIENRNI